MDTGEPRFGTEGADGSDSTDGSDGATAGGLAALTRAVAVLASEALDGQPAVVLGNRSIALDVLISRLRHELARTALAFDGGGGPLADGFPSAAAWLRANTMAAPREASDIVATGRALRDRLPATDSAAAEGRISWSSASAIAYALRGVEDPDILSEADAALAEIAPTLNPSGIPHAARRVLQQLDPALAQRDAEQRWADRTLSLSPLMDGAVRLNGRLDEVSAAVILSALAPMTTPRGPEDTRTAGQRRLDGLVELVDAAVSAGAAGTVTATGLAPTLVVRVDLQTLAGFDPWRAREVLCPDQPSAPASVPLSESGAPLASMAELDWGGPILRDTLERIGCSADIVRLVTSGPSTVLDLGRASRLASPAQRLALAARDRGCIFPGCDRPPIWTDAHHYRQFARGGKTDLADLVLVCRFHHRLLHEGSWRLRRIEDGFEILDPAGEIRGVHRFRYG